MLDKLSYLLLFIVIIFAFYLLLKKRSFLLDPIKEKYYHHIISQSEGDEFQDGDISLKYRLFKSYRNTDSSLLVMLHGSGGRGSDNFKQFDFHSIEFIKKVRKEYDPFILVPQCPKELVWTINPKRPFNNFSIDSIPSSPILEAVRDLIKKVIRENQIDISRVYIIGHSMGGTGLWELILRNPDLFAAAIPICAASDPAHANIVKDIHIWAFSGEDDPYYDYRETREMIDSILKYSSDARFTLLKGKGHDMAKYVYRDPNVTTWLFSKTKKPIGHGGK